MLLRRTPLSKKLTSEQIDARLRDVLLVLKYVNNKDVFMRYHKVHLTRRYEQHKPERVQINIRPYINPISFADSYLVPALTAKRRRILLNGYAKLACQRIT